MNTALSRCNLLSEKPQGSALQMLKCRTDRQTDEKTGSSIGVIVTAFNCFFPIHAILLFNRVNRHVNNRVTGPLSEQA